MTTQTKLKAGAKIIASSGREFKLEKVTDKRVSWHVGFEYKGGNSKNTLKMASTSLRLANEWVENGSWKIV